MFRILALAVFASLLLSCTDPASRPDGAGSSDVSSTETGAAAPVDDRPATGLAESDWPFWRGPTQNGVAARDQNPPTEWSETKNVVWTAEIPGRGHGSPIVVGDKVLLTTADEAREVQSVLCFDRTSGDREWTTDVHTGGFPTGGNKRSSHASTTPAWDGERIFVNFVNGGAAYTTALDANGDQLWQQKLTDYVVHQGYGSSPAIYRSLVIVSADNKGGGAICGLDRASGDVVWRRERPKIPNYASPIVYNVAGRDQLFFSGCELVTSLDPMTGKEIWEIAGSTEECVTSAVTDGTHVFTSGGYPKNHVAAVRVDGSGETTWSNTVRVYVPSMAVHDGHLYAASDAGVAHCWNSATGEIAWRERLGGTFNASVVIVGDHVYATNQDGKTFVYKASPEAFELVGTADLGDEVYASLAICGGRVYARVAHGAGDERKERIYCLGRP